MQRTVHLVITFLFVFLLAACSSTSHKDWLSLVPENASLLIVPKQDSNVQEIISKEYISYLDELSPTAIQQIAALDAEISRDLHLKGLALYPATSLHSTFLWIAEASGALDKWAANFYQPFTQNNYDFNGYLIHKLHFGKNRIFATQANGYLLFSESSLTLEHALQTYSGQRAAIELSKVPEPATFVINTPKLDHWMGQVAAVANRPSVLGKFSGTMPAAFRVDEFADTTGILSLSGHIPLTENQHSVLVDAISFQNKPITLDRHIAGNAATFALLRLPPVSVPLKPDSTLATALDSALLNNMELYQALAGALDDEFAFEAFPESGVQSEGEFLFMRKMRDKRAFRTQLNRLLQEGLISSHDNSYLISSSVLGQLIGSELSTLRDFYISFSDDVVVTAKRKGLAESVNTDRRRRRVIYYDETYGNVRNRLPESISGFVWTDSKELRSFIQPYVKQNNKGESLLSRFDITAITMTAQESGVDVSLNTYKKEGSTLPYEELWMLPLANFELIGKPVLGDIVGGSTDEIVFSTQDGRVMALAIDGTVAMEASTEGLAPIGGPQLYDWYGNSEQIIFLAAGSKIFAWNETGNLLPRFPLEMGEQITAPILVQDVLRNGVPEIVVTTENRKVHVIDGRGENVRGWPQNTNAVVQSQPVFSQVDGTWSIWAFSENTLHSWLRNGNGRPGYPQFTNARFISSPLIFDNQITGAAADGHLYSIGQNPLFSDSLGTQISRDSISVRSLYVANGELTGVSYQENILLKDEADFYRNDLLITQNAGGSLFMYNKEGKLRFTQSLGQPASPTLTPALVDINADRRQELIALAEFGRLYAWEVLTGKRLFGIPTSGMKYPIIADLNGDGQNELIAQTREGLRCWTINRE